MSLPMELPKSGSDKSPIEEKGERTYAGEVIMNPFPNKILLTPSEAIQAINLLSGLLLVDERFRKIIPEMGAGTRTGAEKKYGG